MGGNWDHVFHFKYHLVLILIIVAFIRIWQRKSAKYSEDQFSALKGCKPLRPWSSRWPLGLDLLIRVFQYARKDQILQFFLSIVEESGTTFEQNLLGSRGIDTIEPQNIEAILSKQFTEFGLGLRRPTFFPLLGSGIFTQDGAQWKHSRELMRPQFAQNRAENFEQIKQCVENLTSGIPDREVVDLQPLFFRLTFDTTTFLLFGKTMSSLSSDDIAGKESRFAQAFNVGQDYLSHRGRLGDLYWLINDSTFRNACQVCHEFVDDAVNDAIKDASKLSRKEDQERSSYIFINALIQETQDPKVLRDQCLNILLAGRDTTACCLLWTFRLLARHPSVLSRLRHEIRSIVGLGTEAAQPTRSDLKKMHYLNLVLKEVLRLYPSVPVNSRTALTTTTLPIGGGEDGKSPVMVRRGEAVGYCVYAMHRRKDLYGPDAEEFRPERWEDSSLNDIGWGYLPFNGGPRVCLGQDFALLEAGYTVVRMIQLFSHMELPARELDPVVGKERQTLTLVVASGEGCRVRLTR